MLVCQWHLDIVYGKQADALRAMRAWGAEKAPGSQHWVVYRILEPPVGG